MQFFKFITVGVLSTIINYSLFYALYQLAGLHYLLASAIGFFSGVFAGYFLNKTWTFLVSETRKSTVAKYYSVYLLSLALSLILLEFGVTTLNIPPLIANIIVIGVTTCTNFIGIKYWAFK